MRLLVAGLVLIVAGIAFSEYSRRHPSEKKEAERKGAKKVPNASAAPPTMLALAETETPPADAPGSIDALQKELEGLQVSGGEAVADTRPLLRGRMKVRELKSVADGAVLLLEKDGATGLVKIPTTGAPSLLAVRTGTISTLWFDEAAKELVWGEGSTVKAMPASGGTVTTRAAFVRALVTSVAASGEKTVVTLVPKDGDPFSSEPNGAVAVLSGSEAKLVATEQIRPRDVVFDGTDELFFIAGYPSGLTRAALDGSFTARIAERADGPIALERDALTYRYPQASAPELRRGPRAGGPAKTIARVDVEWLAVRNGVARYTTTGISPRLYETRPDAEPVEVLAMTGVVKGLAWNGETMWLLTAKDEGVVTLQVK